MLIAGRSFATDDPTLAALLRAFGAHVRPIAEAEGTPASPPVVFALEEDAAPRPGAITVLAPGGSFLAVIAPDGRTITGPGDEGRIEWARTHMPVTEAAARALAPWWRAEAWGSPSSWSRKRPPWPSCSPRPGRT